MDLRLAGKGAVITGGNAGIGRAIGRMLAAEGARVLLTGRNEETLGSAKAQIEVAGGEDDGGGDVHARGLARKWSRVSC